MPAFCQPGYLTVSSSQVHTTVHGQRRDSGGVRDGPIPIRELIEGNATFHLQLHLDQLRALLP
jgi:hypothetical protein